jgi:hypothetical protein
LVRGRNFPVFDIKPFFLQPCTEAAMENSRY